MMHLNHNMWVNLRKPYLSPEIKKPGDNTGFFQAGAARLERAIHGVKVHCLTILATPQQEEYILTNKLYHASSSEQAAYQQ